MTGVLAAGLLLALVRPYCCAFWNPDFLLLPQQVQDRGGEIQLSKRDLEFNQYVPSYRMRGEPSCEELRAMWRLSKREARRATTSNHLPRSRAYTFGRTFAYAPDHSSSSVYGTLANYPSRSFYSPTPQRGSFRKLRKMIGNVQPGSFQVLRNELNHEREPGETYQGKLGELKNMLAREDAESAILEDSLRPVSRVLRAMNIRRQHPTLLTQKDSSYSNLLLGPTRFTSEGFVGPLLPGNPSRSPDWQYETPDLSQRMCRDVERATCKYDIDCACAGQFRCSKRRCKVLAKKVGFTSSEEENGRWHSGPLPSNNLGTSNRFEEFLTGEN